MFKVNYFSFTRLKQAPLTDPRFSARRISETAGYKNENARKLSVCAEYALIGALEELAREGEILPEELIWPLEISAGRFEKPDFAENYPLRGKVFFNISHAGECAAAACCGRPVGIDMEFIENRKLEFAERILSEEEAEVYRKLGSEEERRRYFYENWVRKESYLKYLGIGLKILPKELVIQDGFVFPADGSYGKRKTEILTGAPEGYIVSVCM